MPLFDSRPRRSVRPTHKVDKYCILLQCSKKDGWIDRYPLSCTGFHSRGSCLPSAPNFLPRILVQALYKHGRCPSVRQTLYKHGRCPSRLNDSFRCQMFRVEPVQVLLAERAVVISCPSVSSGVQEVDPRSRGPATPWQHDTHSRTRHLAGPTRNLRLAWHRETTAEILPPGCC